ncbi:MAG: fumarylacetoacetate hydrolase family protein [Alphaproteobacteria bacterium]|jgi:2-keto-4-pentenoate hydratase/2-oxohepta-3-ene-1,7-dioic acid hydratase in catechol pathway|tara:strand:+ start:67451 stop:68434 length:984 start_codon:yes stop_codon:yes gene_type:complete
MKLLYFNDYRLGVLKDDIVIDITDILLDIPHRDTLDLMNGLIENFDHYKVKIENFTKTASGINIDKVTLRAPTPRPSNIDCMAVNYMEDGTRAEPAPINAFHKAVSTIIGDGDTMELTDIPATVFEGEAELALVIGKKAHNIKASEAMDYVFGYTNFIDGSARGLLASNFFFSMKSRASYTPIGPYLVTKDEIENPQNLQITLKNNGQVMQNFNTDDMAHNIPRCIEWLSSIHVLQPGDIIATGTNHRGLNPFMDGDKIELEVEKIGKLKINITDPLNRKWARITRREHIEELKLQGAHTPQISGKYAPDNVNNKKDDSKSRLLTSI